MFTKTKSRGVVSLTEREQQVLRLLVAGQPNREIARELGIDVITVKAHVGRLLGKLEQRDRVQLVVFAYESGVVARGSP